MRGGRRNERVSPVRFAVALVRFGLALLAVAPRLLREAAGRPDPITLRPRVLHDAPTGTDGERTGSR